MSSNKTYNEASQTSHQPGELERPLVQSKTNLALRVNLTIPLSYRLQTLANLARTGVEASWS